MESLTVLTLIHTIIEHKDYINGTVGPWSTRQSRLEVQRSKFSGPPLELEHPQVIGAGEHPLSNIFGPAGSQ